MTTISHIRTIAFSAFMVLLALAAYSEAEAQGRQRGEGGGSFRGRGGGGGGPSVGTGLIIQGVIGIMAAQQEEEERRRRRPRPGKLSNEKSKPRCGVRGRPAPTSMWT